MDDLRRSRNAHVSVMGVVLLQSWACSGSESYSTASSSSRAFCELVRDDAEAPLEGLPVEKFGQLDVTEICMEWFSLSIDCRADVDRAE